MNENLTNALETLKSIIISDYLGESDVPASAHEAEWVEGFQFTEGSKYIRVICNNFCWGFIVKTEKDAKFSQGDILKAASYKIPARNKARGNILEGDFSWVRWTGPAYCRAKFPGKDQNNP